MQLPKRPARKLLSTTFPRAADHLPSTGVTDGTAVAIEQAHDGAGRVPPIADPLLTDFDLERLTGKARSTWQKARLTGSGPPFIRMGRLVRYRQSEFERWLDALPSVRSTSEAA